MFTPYNVESAWKRVKYSKRVIWEQSFSQTLSLSLNSELEEHPLQSYVREAQCLFFFQSPDQKCEVCPKAATIT